MQSMQPAGSRSINAIARLRALLSPPIDLAPYSALQVKLLWAFRFGISLAHCLSGVAIMRTANSKSPDEEMSVSPYGDPGRMLVHASIYVWSQARQYTLQAWLEAEEILRHAHNEFENDDRIGFVQRVAGRQL